jgi:glycosyltransferase involved in cell wall biosynthesis
LARFLQVSVSDYHLIHVTSTFSFPAMAAERAALRARRPFVVSPRGSLQSWSLSQKRWKKVPYWFALERRHLRRAARIHVTAELEDEQVRRALPTARTFLVPNGSDFPPVAAVARLPRRLVFLGRLHPKKGFDVLVPALSELARTHPDVETVVAGPDDVGEWPRIEARLAAVSPRPAVRWIGAVGGEAKWELLASARAFVLPSHSENFGQAVVEALACGTPVVVSTNCPWRQIAEKNAGAWIENRPDLLARALRAILDADGAAYAAMQRAALEIAAGFTWPAAAAAMEREYRAVLAEAQEAPR